MELPSQLSLSSFLSLACLLPSDLKRMQMIFNNKASSKKKPRAKRVFQDRTVPVALSRSSHAASGDMDMKIVWIWQQVQGGLLPASWLKKDKGTTVILDLFLSKRALTSPRGPFSKILSSSLHFGWRTNTYHWLLSRLASGRGSGKSHGVC